MKKELRYWDANCCFKWIKKEEDFESLKGTIHKAEKDELEIRTSIFTLVEVFYLKDNGNRDKEKSKEIRKFFENRYVITIGLDIPISDLAREIFFDYNISKPADAIHIASAIFDGIPILNTFDRELLDLNGKIGNPPLEIIKPDINYQENFFEE